AYLFVILAVAVRLLPHPLSFTPVAASLLFFGARGPRRHMWFPIALLIASDVLLSKYHYGYPVTADQMVSWIWYGAMLWLGTWLTNRQRPLPILGAALAASVSFFAISNFAVWAVWSNMYPRSFDGLMACYAAGLPFFRRSVEGDVLFTA